MRCIVTGVAGFIGSRLAAALLDRGDSVVGIDCFTDYYARWIKERNLAPLADRGGYTFREEDIVTADLAALAAEADVIFHHAAQAGVRRSWDREFEVYTRNNILGVQRLLDACVRSRVKRVVFASSSSVYGDAARPFREDSACLPVSPYGITKLAGEHLARQYHGSFGVPVVSLRYFTVYGPGQRPDMAFHRFIRCALEGAPVSLYGDGEQTRDFTFIDDVVDATLAAGDPERAVDGLVMNIAGGSTVSVNDVLRVLGRLTGREIEVDHQGEQRGDVRHTEANAGLARARLDYRPSWGLEEGLEEGLAAEIEWVKTLYGTN